MFISNGLKRRYIRRQAAPEFLVTHGCIRVTGWTAAGPVRHGYVISPAYERAGALGIGLVAENAGGGVKNETSLGSRKLEVLRHSERLVSSLRPITALLQTLDVRECQVAELLEELVPLGPRRTNIVSG